MSWSGKFLADHVEIEHDHHYYASYQLLPPNVCKTCSAPSEEDRCSSCTDLTHFHRVYAIGFYKKGMLRDELSRHILDLKKDKTMAEPLGLALTLVVQNRYPELLKADILVPVPMHDDKLEVNTFNQAQQIAVKVGNVIGKHVLDCIIQTKNFSQHNANRNDRFDNVRDAFHIPTRVSIRVKGRHILLIDDIMTSGATMNECANVLLQNGARLVDGLVLGRTV
jgi:ComF family protein